MSPCQIRVGVCVELRNVQYIIYLYIWLALATVLALYDDLVRLKIGSIYHLFWLFFNICQSVPILVSTSHRPNLSLFIYNNIITKCTPTQTWRLPMASSIAIKQENMMEALYYWSEHCSWGFILVTLHESIKTHRIPYNDSKDENTPCTVRWQWDSKYHPNFESSSTFEGVWTKVKR